MSKIERLTTISTKNIFAIIGREEVEAIIDEIPEGLCWISVTDPSMDFLEYDHKFADVLKMQFWDIEEPIGNYEPLSAEQGKNIKEFILKNRDKKFLINCEAGQSRSAGIGYAIEVLLRDMDMFPKPAHVVSSVFQHWRYSPNMKVIAEILK